MGGLCGRGTVLNIFSLVVTTLEYCSRVRPTSYYTYAMLTSRGDGENANQWPISLGGSAGTGSNRLDTRGTGLGDTPILP